MIPKRKHKCELAVIMRIVLAIWIFILVTLDALQGRTSLPSTVLKELMGVYSAIH